MSTTAGLQVPVTPFEDDPGRTGTVPPAQKEALVPNENAGVMMGLTVTVKLAGLAQTPAFGVNV